MARILVIDDSPTVVLSVSRLLLADGHVVEKVDNVSELSGYLRAMRPDLVLLDLEMPTLLSRRAVNGVEVSIDGRQKNEVFHFPILQTPRSLRRGKPSTGEDAGQMSRRAWCSDGLSRSQSCEGARIMWDM